MTHTQKTSLKVPPIIIARDFTNLQKIRSIIDQYSQGCWSRVIICPVDPNEAVAAAVNNWDKALRERGNEEGTDPSVITMMPFPERCPEDVLPRHALHSALRRSNGNPSAADNFNATLIVMICTNHSCMRLLKVALDYQEYQKRCYVEEKKMPCTHVIPRHSAIVFEDKRIIATIVPEVTES